MLLNARLAASKGDCKSQLPVDGSGAPCLDSDFVDAIAACKYGLDKPADVPLGLWSDFCRAMGTCNWSKAHGYDCTLPPNTCASWMDLPGCPSYDQSYGNTVPGCVDADFKKDHVDYCDKYPHADGPDPKLNEGCWRANKSQTYLYNARVAPLCAGADSSPVTAGMSGGSGMMKWGLIAGAAVVGLVLVARRR